MFLSFNVTANEMTVNEAQKKIVGEWRQYKTKMYEKENGRKVLKNDFIYEEQYRDKLKYTFREDGTYSVINPLYSKHSPFTARYKIKFVGDNLTITFINDEGLTTTDDEGSVTIPFKFEADLLVLGDDDSFNTTFDNYFERVR